MWVSASEYERDPFVYGLESLFSLPLIVFFANLTSASVSPCCEWDLGKIFYKCEDDLIYIHLHM